MRFGAPLRNPQLETVFFCPFLGASGVFGVLRKRMLLPMQKNKKNANFSEMLLFRGNGMINVNQNGMNCP